MRLFIYTFKFHLIILTFYRFTVFIVTNFRFYLDLSDVAGSNVLEKLKHQHDKSKMNSPLFGLRAT